MTATETPPKTPQEHILQWHRLIYRLAKTYTRNRDDAEELATEIVVAVLHRWKSYDPRRAQFSTWLGWVARSAATARRRHRDTHVVPCASLSYTDGTRDDSDTLGALLADPRSPNPVEDADRRIRQQVVAEAIERLPISERRAIRHRFFDEAGGLTPTEREAMHSGLARLAEQLESVREE